MESEKRYYWDTIYGISCNDGTTMGYAMDEDEIIDRLNALEAERDALMHDIGYLLHGGREDESIARSELYDKFTAWVKATQALNGGGDE